MAKIIVQHRRGTKEEWETATDVIPKAGELVIELDEEDHLHKLKIGDGETSYANLAYLKAGDEVVSQVLATALPRIVTVNLPLANWTECDGTAMTCYSQTLSLGNITEHSRLDLQPDVDMLAEFKNLGLIFVTKNINKELIVYSMGNKPEKDYNIQATIVETNILAEVEAIVSPPVGGSSLSLSVGDGKNSIEQNVSKSEAFSENAIAFGEKTKAGMRGYKIVSVNDNVEPVAGTSFTIVTANEIDNELLNNGVCLSVAGFWWDLNQEPTKNGKVLSVTITDQNTLNVLWQNQKYAYVLIKNHPECGDTDLAINALSIGNETVAGGENAFSLGIGAQAMGKSSASFGHETLASANGAFAHGSGTKATHNHTRAGGVNTEASAQGAEAIGNNTVAGGTYSNARGEGTEALGYGSEASGHNTVANASYSRANGEGTVTDAVAKGSNAEGYGTKTIGEFSHSEGGETVATTKYSHASGSKTVAGVRGYNFEVNKWFKRYAVSSYGDVIEGDTSKYEVGDVLSLVLDNEVITNVGKITKIEQQPKNAAWLWVEDDDIYAPLKDYPALSVKFLFVAAKPHVGNENINIGFAADAKGVETKAYGKASSASGMNTEALHQAADVAGYNTRSSAPNQFVRGEFNADNAEAIAIFGNGKSDAERSNALEILRDGSIQAGFICASDISANMIDINTLKASVGKFTELLVADQPVATINDADAKAKDYADNAESNAKNYTDEQVENVDAKAKSYADNAESNAKNYTDGVIGDIDGTVKEYVDDKFALSAEGVDALNQFAEVLEQNPDFVATVTTQVEEHETRLGDIESHLENHDEKITKLEDTVSALESFYLDYVEDTEAVSPKTVPARAYQKAALRAVGGGFTYDVTDERPHNLCSGGNEDSVISIRILPNDTTGNAYLTTLPAGIYSRSSVEHLKSDDLDVRIVGDDWDKGLSEIFILNKQTDIFLCAERSANSPNLQEEWLRAFHMMINAGNRLLSFSPYVEYDLNDSAWPGLKPIKHICAYSQDGSAIVGRYDIPQEIYRQPLYGSKYCTLDFDTRELRNDLVALTLDGSQTWTKFDSGIYALRLDTVGESSTLINNFGSDLVLDNTGMYIEYDNNTAVLRFDDVEQWEQYLAAYPIRVYYRAAEPTDALDVSQWLTDYEVVNVIEVESGGTVVFKGYESDTGKNSTPNHISYIV